MEMYERIAGSNAGVKTKTVPNNTEKCKISLPKIIIYDVDGCSSLITEKDHLNS